MPKARRGDTVQVHFTGTLDGGQVFDSSEDGGEQSYRNFRGQGIAFSPLQIVLGQGELPPKVEDAVVGLAPGESATVRVAPEDAYGPRDERLVTVVPRGDLRPREPILETWRMAEDKRLRDPGPSVGDVLEVGRPDGPPVPALVTAVTDTHLTIDANHPLAGKDLTFAVRLVGIL